jgi:hypothetical protein
MAMKKKIVPINYSARDFNSIKGELVEYAKRYYSDTYKDFNEASFGSFMLDTVAYIGDVLSFYVDYSANESHLKTSIEYDNILKHGYKFGYKHNPFASSYGTIVLYCLVPALPSGLGPNLNYAPVLKKNSTFSAGESIFTLVENVNMANPNFTVRVARTDSETGVPTYYAIKGFGTVVSGEYRTISIDVGDFKRFLKLQISAPNVTDVISVFDSEGNEYFEVDYLSQNISYKEIPNNQNDKDAAPNILVPFAVPRRFTIERDSTSTYLLFGASSEAFVENEQMIEDPSRFVMNIYGKNCITDESFDPKRLLTSDKFGIGPSNTTVTITYRVNSTANTNASVGTLNTVGTLITEFADESSLNSGDVVDVKTSFICDNEDPIVGSISIPTSDELKIRILNNFSAQNRAVTEKDYEALSYSMPAKFGAIKRVKIFKDQDSFKRNLNLYVISEDRDGKLIKSSINIKNNLKTWINKNKVISDTIDIIDAKIVNLSIDFTAIGVAGKSRFDIQSEALMALREYFNRKPEIGEPFFITDVLSVLKKVNSVLDVRQVIIKTKMGINYASTSLDINVDTNLPFYDSIIRLPQNVIWEIKFPDNDIRGTII